MTISFQGRVAIVTGAGGGLGRAYALELARRGARVVVNDLGGSRDGSGQSDSARAVVEEIRAAGGEAVVDGGNVTDSEQMRAMAEKARADWGGVHILINNAGILRDKSFAKMHDDFRAVVTSTDRLGQRHPRGLGAMREQAYGRILMTARPPASTAISASQLRRGQLGRAGFARTLALEGAKYNVRVNTIAPTAATRMTQELFPPELLDRFRPELVAPAALFLVSDDAPTGAILGAGAGVVQAAYVTLTRGAMLAEPTPRRSAPHGPRSATAPARPCRNPGRTRSPPSWSGLPAADPVSRR